MHSPRNLMMAIYVYQIELLTLKLSWFATWSLELVMTCVWRDDAEHPTSLGRDPWLQLLKDNKLNGPT